MFTIEFVIFLLCLSLLLWGIFCGWLAGGKKYGVSFFCALVQAIVLLGYVGILICARFRLGDDIFIFSIGMYVMIISAIVSLCVVVASMLAAIKHGQKQDKITLGLSVWQSLCYFWIVFKYMVPIFWG
ncbi:MAG: hypothetical protein IKZ46_15515 [Victivallales bacterium]|nr:hypothetical protein [Victivallales bacterium]